VKISTLLTGVRFVEFPSAPAAVQCALSALKPPGLMLCLSVCLETDREVPLWSSEWHETLYVAQTSLELRTLLPQLH
jgi:hypothetical protein